MDPWPGNGYGYGTHAWVHDDGEHHWANTLTMAGYRVLPGGDYNGDGNSDIAIFRPSTGLWSVRGIAQIYFGSAADKPVPGNYSGDLAGAAEIAVFRHTTGLWSIRDLTRLYFGSAGDIPVPMDYYNYGWVSPAIYRPSTGRWSILGLGYYYLGEWSDIPVPALYLGKAQGDWFAVFRPRDGRWAIAGLTRLFFGSPADLPVTR